LSEIGVGSHPSAWRADVLIDEMAGSTIHCESCEGPWETHPWRCCFGEIHDRIADRKGVIHVPARIQVSLKSLSKAGFDKQAFSDSGLGSGCPCCRDRRWGGSIAAPTTSDEEKREEDQR